MQKTGYLPNKVRKSIFYKVINMLILFSIIVSAINFITAAYKVYSQGLTNISIQILFAIFVFSALIEIFLLFIYFIELGKSYIYSKIIGFNIMIIGLLFIKSIIIPTIISNIILPGLLIIYLKLNIQK
jgi:hypothetical protein